jgi:flagellar hook-length control protein FliK
VADPAQSSATTESWVSGWIAVPVAPTVPPPPEDVETEMVAADPPSELVPDTVAAVAAGGDAVGLPASTTVETIASPAAALPAADQAALGAAEVPKASGGAPAPSIEVPRDLAQPGVPALTSAAATSGRDEASGPTSTATTPTAPTNERTKPSGARVRPTDDHVHQAARQALRSALSEIGDAHTAPRGSGPAPETVATQALAVGMSTPTPSVPKVVATDKPTSADVDADWLAFASSRVAVSQAPETASRHSGRDQSGHGGDQGLPTFARAASSGTPNAVPASMVFPSQAGFATALDLASVGASTPSFSSHVLQTVGPQAVRGLQLQVAAGGGDMTLTLTPEHLGTVTIEVKVDQQRVVATLTSDTPAVRGWMAAHEQDLKSGLADLGLTLDELVVREDDSRQDQQREQGAPERRRKPKDEESAVAFEVLV